MTVNPEVVQPVTETSSTLVGEVPGQESLTDAALDQERRGKADGTGPGGNLGQQVRRGALWSAGSVVVMRIANIAVMAVVARLVAPKELGVFTVALVVHAMVLSIAELGVASAVARSDLDPDKTAPTVVTISVINSFLLAAFMAAFAQPLADLLGSPQAAAPLRVLSLTVAMIGPFAVPGAQLQREFKQSRLFLATFVSFIPSSAVLIVLASTGDGAMAFAWSRVVGFLVAGAITMASVSKHYWPGFRLSQLQPLLRFGLPLAFANLLSQLLLNVDYAFVGRISGVEQLGFYTLAFNIAAWSTAVIGSMLNGVVLPAFSKVKQEEGALEAAMHKATRSVALVACPIGFLTLALAYPLIVTVYGAKWSAAAPVLQVLSLYGVIFVICLLFANIIIAMGRTGVLLIVQVVALAALVPAIRTGISLLGLVGVGAAHILVISVVTLPAYLVAIRRSTGSPAVMLLRAATPPVVAAATASLAAWGAASLISGSFLKLLVGGLAGGLVYIVLIAPFLSELLPPSIIRVRSVNVSVRMAEMLLCRLTRRGATPLLASPRGGDHPGQS